MSLSLSEPLSPLRSGGWIQTYTGKKFYPFDPRPEDFDIRDIAHALSLLCRFGGHCSKLYSVAEHCVRVVRALGDWAGWRERLYDHSGLSLNQLLYAALMHDASEAYLGDLPRPLKHMPEFQFYLDTEDRLMNHLSRRFQFLYPLPGIVQTFDSSLLGGEGRDLMAPPIESWHLRYHPHHGTVRPWSARTAERRFLDLYYHLNPLGEQRKPWFAIFRKRVA